MRVDVLFSLALALAASCAPPTARRPSGSSRATKDVTAPSASGTGAATKTWFVPFFGSWHVEGVSWSPDGKLGLLRQPAERALLFGADQAAPIAGVPIAGYWSGAAWSRDGTRLAVVEDSYYPRLTLLDLAAPERTVTWKATSSDWPFEPVGFLPDGRRIVARVGRSAVRVLDAATGAPQGPEYPVAEHSGFGTPTVLALAWTRPWLAHGVPDGGFAVTDVETGTKLFASDRKAKAALWLTTAPKLAVTSENSVLVWDREHGPIEYPVNGTVTWDRRGDRFALISPRPSPSGEQDHCRDCLRPAHWSSVIAVPSGRELSSAEFLPDGKRHELSPFSNAAGSSWSRILDLETNELSSLKFPAAQPFASINWRRDGSVVMRGTRWDVKVTLPAGRVAAWRPWAGDRSSFHDPDTRTVCEDDRWTLRERFSGKLLAKLGADTTCEETYLRAIGLPLVAYVTKNETRIVDADSGKAVARLAGESVASDSGAVTVVRRVNSAHCEVFDPSSRTVIVTPEIRKSGGCGFHEIRGISVRAGYFALYLFSPKKGFLSGKARTPRVLPFCRTAHIETEHGFACLETTNGGLAVRVWDAKSDAVTSVVATGSDPVTREAILALGKAEPSTKWGLHNIKANPSGSLVAFVALDQVFVLTLSNGSVAPWGPRGCRQASWRDEHTLILSGRDACNLGAAVRDGVTLEGIPPDPEKLPDRPSTPRGQQSRPSGDRAGFRLYSGAPPFVILRLSDRQALRLWLIEGKDRPYSVLFDEHGHFAGDDEAARSLSYARGRDLRNATLHNGLDVADLFRRPDVIASFFRP